MKKADYRKLTPSSATTTSATRGSEGRPSETRANETSRQHCAAHRWLDARRATRKARPPRRLPAHAGTA